MAGRFSPAAANALREALATAYWYKDDLKVFLRGVLSDPGILSQLDWQAYKIRIVSELMELLLADEDRYRSDLEALCEEVCKIRDYSHLLRLDDGKTKARRGKDAIGALHSIWATHERAIDAAAEAERRRELQLERKLESDAFVQKLEALRGRYFEFVMKQAAQRRGYELEKLLYDVFELFDLDPKASFKVVGEQVDGAFSLEGTDYLLEAKWQQTQVSLAALDALDRKLNRRLKNALYVLALNPLLACPVVG